MGTCLGTLNHSFRTLRFSLMITRSEDYVEYCREVATHLRDVEDLALRGKNTSEITRRVNASITREVDLTPGDDLVDIGCGDIRFST